jgi:hypothetical protein
MENPIDDFDYESFMFRQRIKTEEDINSPVSWLCVDCGVNTSPGMSTRAEIYKAMVLEGKKEVPQEITCESEIYTVRNAIWKKARMEDFGGCLCIGCLEKRLGRKLKPKDFDRHAPFNSPHLPGTKRLLDRRGRR